MPVFIRTLPLISHDKDLRCFPFKILSACEQEIKSLNKKISEFTVLFPWSPNTGRMRHGYETPQIMRIGVNFFLLLHSSYNTLSTNLHKST